MNQITRVFIYDDPFPEPGQPIYRRGAWPVQWLEHPAVRGAEPAVVAYRRIFTLSQAEKFRLHISADERYELFVDGERVGRGSERGDRN